MAKRGRSANPDVVEESLDNTRTRDDIAAAVAAERATLDDEDQAEEDGEDSGEAETRGTSADPGDQDADAGDRDADSAVHGADADEYRADADERGDDAGDDGAGGHAHDASG